MNDLADEFLNRQVAEPDKEYDLRVFAFERLDVWNRSLDLVEWIYDVTSSFPNEEKFVLPHRSDGRPFLFHPILLKVFTGGRKRIKFTF